jgi:hypothetical protein
MTTTTTLTSTLSSLEVFTTTMVVTVGLVENMFRTFIFLGQSSAWCLKLEQIFQGYFKGILIGLTGCVVTLTIDSTTLVGTIGIIGFFSFLVMIGFFGMTCFTIV